MTAHQNSLSFYLAGDDILIIHCIEEILRRKHQIYGVLTQSNEVRKYLAHNSIPSFNNLNSFLKKTATKNADYFLSISSSFIFPETLAKTIKCLAINYHNSLLPRYAGLNASSWAIMNGETLHGVTWHILNKKIDSGNILIQERFNIENNETAYSLNMKCFEYALFSLNKLLTKIETNDLEPIPQDNFSRTYYGFKEASEYDFFINFDMPSSDIYRLFRALDFKNLENELSAFKLYIKGSVYIIKNLYVLPTNSAYTSGLIISSDHAKMIFSSKTSDIAITKLCQIDGEPIEIENLVKQHRLKIGYPLYRRPDWDFRRYKKLKYQVKKNEKTQISLLQSYKPASWCFIPTSPHRNQHKKSNSFYYEEELTINNIADINSAITAILILLYKINNYENFSIWYTDSQLIKEVAYLKELFIPYLPLNSDLHNNECPLSSIRKSAENILGLKKMGPIEKEVFFRYPHIFPKRIKKDVLIHIDNGNASIFDFKEFSLIISLNTKLKKITISHALYYELSSTVQILVKNLASCINEIMKSFAEDKNIRIKNIPYTPTSQVDDILFRFNNTAKVFKTADNIYDAIFSSDLKLENDAVITHDRKYSYRDLKYDVIELAKEISKFIPKQAQNIPIIFDRNYSMLVSILALLKENLTFVPLNPESPAKRVSTILKDSGAQFILGDSKYTNKINRSMTVLSSKRYSKSNVCMDMLLLENINHTSKDLNNVAYIAYTSGTTGKPKGVMVTHANVLNYAFWFKDVFHLSDKSRMDFSSTISFDVSIACTIVPFIASALVCICPEKTKRNSKSYIEYLIDMKVTHIECTPGYFNRLLNFSDKIKQLNHLEWVLLGSEPIMKSDVRKWLLINPQHNLVNEYGPTECTVAISQYTVSDKDLHDSSNSIPIGKPCYNNNIYILDKYYNICPIGVPGQICISGKSVSLGYHNQRKQTNEVFIKNPLSNYISNDNIVYLSGDIGFWLNDGNIDYIGRNDDQIKISGYRIELAEIQSILLAYQGIKECHIEVVKEPNKVNCLEAYLVKETNVKIRKNEIENFLKKNLPNYMIPHRYYIIDKIPLNTNEKTDKNKLKTVVKSSLLDEYSGSSNRETFLLKALMAINGNNNITKKSTFTEIGLTSLQAIRLITEIEDYYSETISLADFLKHNTVEDLLKYLMKKEKKLVSIRQHESCSSAIVLKKNGNNIPLFLFHPLGGSVFWYRHFAKYIDKDRPIIAFQDPGLDNNDYQFKSLEEMAEFYVQIIMKIQKNGPYCLAGASFGATLAIAAAQILKQNNQKVEFIGLLDGWATYSSSLLDKNIFYKILRKEYQRLKNQYTQLGITNADKYIENRYQRELLLINYQIPKIDSKLTLFKATEESPLLTEVDKDPYNGWRKFSTQDIEVIYIEGNHESIFNEPYVKELVGKINHKLAPMHPYQVLLNLSPIRLQGSEG